MFWHLIGDIDKSGKEFVAQEPDDLQLVERAKAGDRLALGALVARYEKPMYNVALGITGHRQDAEDALQETFLTLVRRLDAFRAESRLSTWLYRVAVNASLQILRKRRPQVSLDDEEANIAEPADELTPLKWMLSEEAREVLDRAINGLPQSLRTVFVLREQRGLSTSETAEVLELTEQAVKNRLHRARVSLRDAVAPYFEEKEPIADEV